MSQEEYRSIIYAGSEDRNREYKSSFPWDRSTHGSPIAKVTKSILAMGNLRDGGHIVFGVEEISESGTSFNPIGMQNQHLRTFSYDTIADFVRNYAEPYVTFNLDQITLDEKNFIVISVIGFEENPVVCKKSYDNILAEGTVYIRSRSGRPRSEPLTNYPDMRELLDLAIERGVRRFLETQARVGNIISSNDEEQFNQQLVDFS
ncbi:MAG: ATP-binding protein [Anaerolineae bacterium]|nr:ATP-binding protein [Anaerolineae bacterium]